MFVAIGFEKDFTIGSAIFGSYGFPWVELSVSISSISTTTNKRGQPAKSPTPQVEWKLDWELTRKTHQRKWLVGTFMFLTAITYEIPRIAQKFPYSVLGRLQFKLKFWSMYPLEVEISKVLKYSSRGVSEFNSEFLSSTQPAAGAKILHFLKRKHFKKRDFSAPAAG